MQLRIILKFPSGHSEISFTQLLRERETEMLFHEVSFIGQFVAEPETGPLLRRTVLWDCFKGTNTYFIGSVCDFRKPKTAQKYHTTQHRSIK